MYVENRETYRGAAFVCQSIHHTMQEVVVYCVWVVHFFDGSYREFIAIVEACHCANDLHI